NTSITTTNSVTNINNSNTYQHHHQILLPSSNTTPPLTLIPTGARDGWSKKRISRRLMIGSTARTCTYNECRGCKFRCKDEQIPVDENDPVNSAYHYRCVCHR
ncbi:hypothetical protein MKX03_002457, partial [Papaver bracteatum]